MPKTIESIWQELFTTYPLLGAVALLVLSQLIVSLFQEFRNHSQRRFEANMQRFKDLRDAYEKCLLELSLARRHPIVRNDPPEERGVWHTSKSFLGAMAGLTPLLALLTMLESYSWLCKQEIRDARRYLQSVLNEAHRRPERTIRKGPGNRPNTTMKVREDCGLAVMTDELIEIVSKCAQKDLGFDPNRGRLRRIIGL